MKLPENNETVLPLLRASSSWLEACSVFRDVADRKYLARCAESSDKRIQQSIAFGLELRGIYRLKMNGENAERDEVKIVGYSDAGFATDQRIENQ